jgi:hypothetical protein
MPWEGSFHFTTVFSPGTDPSSLPTAATVAANPKGLFADGLSTATVQITNISRNGVLVPDGTKIAVTSQPDFQTDTTGDAIIGGVTSPTDARYQIVTTVGGAAIVTYQSPNLPDLAPGAASYGYIQVRSVDAGNRIAGAVGSGQVVLFRAKSAQIDVSQPALFADGSTSSQVRITVIAGARPMAGLALMTDPSTSLTFVQSPMDPLDQPVPPGTKIGVTVQPVYRNDSLGGTITGGTPAPDSRFTVFTTTGGGTIDLTYTSPALPITQSGDAWIQVVEVDDEGNNVGLIGLMNISLYGF